MQARLSSAVETVLQSRQTPPRADATLPSAARGIGWFSLWAGNRRCVWPPCAAAANSCGSCDCCGGGSGRTARPMLSPPTLPPIPSAPEIDDGRREA
ncbi:MAG: hypothetical protein R3E31_19320 [Chloroflexota bacterium]